jgi:hypothetical protein
MRGFCAALRDRNMEAERLNLLATQTADLTTRLTDLRRYL